MNHRALVIAPIALAALLTIGCGPAPVSSRTFEQAQSYQSYSAEAFVNALSQDEAFALAAGRTASVTRLVILPDGGEREVAFVPFQASGPGPVTVPLVPATSEDDRTLSEAGWEPDADAQRQWKANAEVGDLIERTYGIRLDSNQRERLRIPDEAPETLTRYGSTRLTFPSTGGYFDGEVTLIWDGEFKLIGSEGTDRAAELTRP